MITPEMLADVPLLSRLTPEERAELAARAADVRVPAGGWLLHEGEAAYFFVLLEGKMEARKLIHGQEQVVYSYEPGDCFGEVPLLLGSPAIASLRAPVESRVMRLDPLTFETKLACHPAVGHEILRTMLKRVVKVRNVAGRAPERLLRLVGDRAHPECCVMRRFLATNGIEHQWWEQEEALQNGIPLEQLPTDGPGLVNDDGSVVSPVSCRGVAEMSGLQTRPQQKAYDVVIVGAGPSGLAAAVYGASEGLTTLVVDREGPGGQAGTSSHIANYLGFPNGLSGDELARRAFEQARNFGAEIVVTREVRAIDLGASNEPHAVLLDDDERVATCTVVLASGVRWRRFAEPSVARLEGRGVYYGSSRTEALDARGAPVFLVGGGNAAGQAALYMADYSSRVTLLARRELEATMSDYLIKALHQKPNITIRANVELVGARGEDHLEAVLVRERGKDQIEEHPARLVFLLIGADPDTAWLPSRIRRDLQGYIQTGRDLVADAIGRANWPLQGDPYFLETSVPGIFAVGDVRSGSVKRCASAVGEGSMSIAFVHQFLKAAAGGIDDRLEKAAALRSIKQATAAIKGV